MNKVGVGGCGILKNEGGGLLVMEGMVLKWGERVIPLYGLWNFVEDSL